MVNEKREDEWMEDMESQGAKLFYMMLNLKYSLTSNV